MAPGTVNWLALPIGKIVHIAIPLAEDVTVPICIESASIMLCNVVLQAAQGAVSLLRRLTVCRAKSVQTRTSAVRLAYVEFMSDTEEPIWRP